MNYVPRPSEDPSVIPYSSPKVFIEKKRNPEIGQLAQEFLAGNPTEDEKVFLEKADLIICVLGMSQELKRKFMDLGISFVTSNLNDFKLAVSEQVQGLTEEEVSAEEVI